MPAAPFRPLVVNALYPGLDRGLAADLLVARALGGRALAVCTSLIVAGGGRVADVLDVPSDTVEAQLQHLLATDAPTGAKLSILGDFRGAITAIEALSKANVGSLVLDVTLSGPEGEDLADGRVRDALVERFSAATLVTLRAVDAALVAGMEIETLEDAQVAVQRLHLRGAASVLLRLPALPASTADAGSAPAGGDGSGAALPYRANLFYDGRDFSLVETPDVPGGDALAGASSALTLALLKGLVDGRPVVEAVQMASAYAFEAVRLGLETAPYDAPAYLAAYGRVYAR